MENEEEIASAYLLIKRMVKRKKKSLNKNRLWYFFKKVQRKVLLCFSLFQKSAKKSAFVLFTVSGSD